VSDYYGTKHHQEPWQANEWHCGFSIEIACGELSIAEVFEESDGHHLVAVHNACLGINPEAVPEMLAVLRDINNDHDLVAAMNTCNECGACIGCRLRAVIAKATPDPQEPEKESTV